MACHVRSDKNNRSAGFREPIALALGFYEKEMSVIYTLTEWMTSHCDILLIVHLKPPLWECPVIVKALSPIQSLWRHGRRSGECILCVWVCWIGWEELLVSFSFLDAVYENKDSIICFLRFAFWERGSSTAALEVTVWRSSFCSPSKC